MENSSALNQFFDEWFNGGPVRVDTKILIPRSGKERRSSQHNYPPYFTEEGIVMFDRRETQDRRQAAWGTQFVVK